MKNEKQDVPFIAYILGTAIIIAIFAICNTLLYLIDLI